MNKKSIPYKDQDGSARIISNPKRRDLVRLGLAQDSRGISLREAIKSIKEKEKKQ